jgi:glutathione S-transferase
VYAFLVHNNIPFTLREVEIINGDNRKEDYVKINPNKNVPAITDAP